MTDRRAWQLAFAVLSTFLFTSPLMGKEQGMLLEKGHRSPVDLAISPNHQWIVTANETSNSVSLIHRESRELIDEIAVGEHPSDVVFGDQEHVLVATTWSGNVDVLRIDVDSSGHGRLIKVRSIEVGFQPCGLASTGDGIFVYAGLLATGQVAKIDWQAGNVVSRFDVGNWPKYLTLSPNGSRLAVGCGDGKVVVIDPSKEEVLYDEPLSSGLNLGHQFPSADGTYTYFTWMVYRPNPITVGNIRRGWVLASRIGRVRLDGPAYREAISLDVPGLAVADPHGIGISPDESTLVATGSGTHELLVYRLKDLPFIGAGGPGDLIDRQLQHDRERFFRIDVGGRPLGLAYADNSERVYVANYLRNCVQVIDLSSKDVSEEISLGSATRDPARKGMEIFYDGTRSLDQWYSCHSCHQDGGVNSRPMDTMNDGTEKTLKTVLPLADVHETGPWTWHGWQTSLDNAMHKSFTSTMIGKAPSDEERTALLEYLKSIRNPPNPFLVDGQLTRAAERGKAIFESARGACIDCHSGSRFTDGQVHDVGLGSDQDFYEGYNTPSLVALYRKLRYLHSGRAKTLERVVTELHSPERVNGTGKLTEQETQDLIAYLKSL